MQIAFGIAVVETALVLVSELQWRWALIAAGLVFALHFFVGRRSRFASVRELSWAAAISQTVPVLVPLLLVVVGTLLVLAIAGAAVVVLALVFLGRR